MAKEKDGCAIFRRRTFLFFVGLAIAKLLKKYFSVAQNPASIALKESWQSFQQQPLATP